MLITLAVSITPQQEMDMNKRFSGLKMLAAGLALGLTSQFASALVVDPVAGASGAGGWTGGLGSSVTFDGFGGSDTQLSLTLTGTSKVHFRADDCCVTGDAFGLIIDGISTPWTTEIFPGGVGGNFTGLLTTYLGAGTHIFELQVTADCCGSGGMSWAMDVPEPGSLALLSLGLIGLGAARRRQA